VHQDALHPYTVGLLRARPEIGSRSRIQVIPGRPVSAFEAGQGCVFAARCPYATETCRTVRPVLRSVGSEAAGVAPCGSQLVACHRAEELKGRITFTEEVAAHD
jgi:oligopeptide/dipeptide ABC transporter ATP-binding protein